jgi:hypothetical protein
VEGRKMPYWCNGCGARINQPLSTHVLACAQWDAAKKREIEELLRGSNIYSKKKEEIAKLIEKGYCRDTMAPAVQPVVVATSQIVNTVGSTDFIKQKQVIGNAQAATGVRPRIKEILKNYLHSWADLENFKYENFQKRIDISGPVLEVKVFYRRMAYAEYVNAKSVGNIFQESTAKKPNKGAPFDAGFNYTNTALYRYWMSTSLAKVNAFGNENSSDSGSSDVIAKIAFSEDLLKKYAAKISIHQTKNVQETPDKVALHREGFAEIGNLVEGDLKELLQGKYDFNLGFTSHFSKELQGCLESFELLNTK